MLAQSQWHETLDLRVVVVGSLNPTGGVEVA